MAIRTTTRPNTGQLLFVTDSQGRLVPENDFHRWAQWFESANRQIEDTHFGETRISTVLLGSAIDVDSLNRPLVYETLIFAAPPLMRLDSYMQRTATVEDARRVHAEFVEMAKMGLGNYPLPMKNKSSQIAESIPPRGRRMVLRKKEAPK
jgi:hypothetical protein